MAVLAGDLLAPTGELEETLFPDGSLTTRVEEWIADGEERAAALEVAAEHVDAAVTAWVYHRAYKAASIRILSTPEQETIGSTSRRMTIAQANALRSLADYYLSIFNALAPEEEAPATGLPGSFGVRNVPVW